MFVFLFKELSPLIRSFVHQMVDLPRGPRRSVTSRML